MNEQPLPGMDSITQDRQASRRKTIDAAESNLRTKLTHAVEDGLGGGRISNRQLQLLRKAIDKVLEARS